MSEFLSEEELEGVRKIRDVMGGKIPEALDTDFNLRRWWNGHNRDLDVIQEKMSTYIRNRKLLGFDRPNFVESFYNRKVSF